MASRLPPLNRFLIAQLPFLSWRDRLLLDEVLDPQQSPLDLSRVELQQLCGHRFRDWSWQPADWLEAAKTERRLLSALGIDAVSWADPDYPAILRETSRPPYLLYIRGRLQDASLPALAMVGTRFPTGRGLEAAARLAQDAASHGVAIISGLARGIDAAAHAGAVRAAMPTLAVLGCGIDQVYPRSNRPLAAKILANGGALISEYPPGIRPARWTFPERNRIIAGLARSTVVVEAPEKSGALITAGFALEEGRDVYVAAACLGSTRAKGSDRLAADGARPIHGFADILDDWGGVCGRVGEAGYPYRAGMAVLTRRRMDYGYN